MSLSGSLLSNKGDGGGVAVVADDQALASEQMTLANQKRAPSSLEAEFRFQQLLNNNDNSNTMGPGNNNGVGLRGIPGGLPTDNPENTELVRLLRMRDQLERKYNG